MSRLGLRWRRPRRWPSRKTFHGREYRDGEGLMDSCVEISSPCRSRAPQYDRPRSKYEALQGFDRGGGLGLTWREEEVARGG